MQIDQDKEQLASELKGSLLKFCQYFYPLLTSRDFIISNPMGRESHVITICRALTRAARLELPSQRLWISVPPGHGKSTMLLMWVAWTLARYPDSKYLYISYSVSLAAKHTETIKRIIQLPHYKYLFDVAIRHDARGKEFFQTTDGGSIQAFGSTGSIVGCFESESLVCTEKGLITIGEIVSKKMELNAYSYNVNTNQIELKPIVNWFNNPRNEIIEIEFSDNTKIRCTPGHRIHTINRGFIKACELLCTDQLLAPHYDDITTDPQHFSSFSLRNSEVMHNSPFFVSHPIINGCLRYWCYLKDFFSASHDYSSSNAKPPTERSNWNGNIYNSVQFFIGKFVIFKLSSMDGPNTVGVSFANSIHPNVNYCSSRNSKFFGNFTGRNICKTKMTNFFNFIGIKFFKSIHRSMFKSILNVLRSSSIAKILNIIIQSIPIKVTNITCCRPRPNKRHANKMVNRSIFSTRFCSKTNRVVSSGSNPWFEYFTNIKNRQSIRINNDSVIASNQSSFGNAIVSIGTRNKNPISIKYICHAEKTFCIEVKDNHNFIINGFNGLTIVGNSDGGSPGLDRFSGGVILDDLHKIDEAHSDTIRNSVISNYRETIQQRARGVNVPFIGIGQRVHEEDIAAYLLAGNDGYNWEHVVLKAIDDAGNALYPEAFPLEMLLVKQKHDPYVFSSQFQQQPVPPGGALFKPEWFVILDEEPEIIMTFITADTAETNKSWNDATVFSFWGLYDIELSGRKTGQLGLHWLDCVELRIEPKDLKPSFIEFWQGCMVHPKPPVLAAIEKKSTGVTLISVLDEIRGIQIRQIERTRASGSKTQRFLEIQPIIAAKRISFTNSARHVKLCIDHMIKITASDAHRWDDICDSAADAIRIALIDKTLSHAINSSIDYNRLAKTLTFDHNKVNRLKKAAYTR